MPFRREDIPFPAERLPDDAGLARLLGLYAQRQEGRYMQRVRVLGGRLSAGQWRALADIARRHTPTAPLHLTTRQDVELHDVTAERVPAVQAALHAAGLTSVGACGDTFRNITVCPHSGAAAGCVELIGLAEAIRDLMADFDGVYSLPRKFKVSLSACRDGCGGPFINDVGFVARPRADGVRFLAVVAGSLGAKPGTGVVFEESLSPRDVLPLVLAAVRLFAAHGDRENRRRARLRHVRERMGDENFLSLLRQGLATAQAERDWPEIPLPEAAGLDGQFTLTFPNGDVTPEAAEALAELAERDDLAVRVANHHRVLIFARDVASARRAVEDLSALRKAAGTNVSVVACPGTRWCSHGLADTNALADRIRAELGPVLAAGSTVCISGCPNGCAHNAVADLGLSGRQVTAGGGKADAWDLRVGGGMGRDNRLAEPRATKLSGDQVVAKIRELVNA